MTEESSGSAAPRLSVLITSYNYARFLPDSVGSVLSQTFTDFELIVVDNASTDNSRELLQEYAARDDRIQLCLRDENQGVQASLKQAFELASGELCMYVNADDWALDSTAVADQIHFLDNNPGVSFVYSPLVMVGPDGETAFVSESFPTDTVVPGELALEALLGFNLNISGLIFRSDAYRRVGGWPDRNIHVSDQQLAARLAEVGDVGYMAREMYAFRLHGSNFHAESDLGLMRDEVLPMIEATFDSPLGQRVPEARKVRRRITRNALVHRPTQYIFQDNPKMGWRVYWESVRVEPFLTIVQPRTLSLLARTVLGKRGYESLRKSVDRLVSLADRRSAA